MSNAYFTIAKPANDPFLGYLPGSPERAALKEELARQAAEVVKIPLIIGGREVWTEETIQITMPHDHRHVIAQCCMAGEKELKDMIAEGKPIEVKCHFCNRAYRFTVADMERLLERAK